MTLGFSSGLSWVYVVSDVEFCLVDMQGTWLLSVLVSLCGCCFDLDFDVEVCTFDSFVWLWILISLGGLLGMVLDCSWYWVLVVVYVVRFCLVGVAVLGVWRPWGCRLLFCFGCW